MFLLKGVKPYSLPFAIYSQIKDHKAESYTDKPVQMRKQDKIDLTELINPEIMLERCLYKVTAQHAEQWWTL